MKPLERWQALAWAIVKAKPGSHFATALDALFITLLPADKLACRAEIHECRKAMRGEIFATIEESNNATV